MSKITDAYERVVALRPDELSDEEIENADSEDYGRYVGTMDTIDSVLEILREVGAS